MASSKRIPSHNLLATAAMNAAAKAPPPTSTNAGPYDAMLWYYSTHSHTNPLLPSRVATAYPALPSQRPDPSAAVSHLRSWQQRWFTTINKTWLAIRANIFTHLFTHTAEYIYPNNNFPRTWTLRDDDKIASILLVCKQLRREALPVYNDLVLVDIGACGPLVSPSWFGNSTKLSDNVRNIQFKGWEVAMPSQDGGKMVPAEMVDKILERFPRLESLVIEAPEDGDHHTIKREDGGCVTLEEKKAQVPGFAGLLRSEMVERQLAEVDFEGIFEMGEDGEEGRVREEFEDAVGMVSEKAGDMMGDENGEVVVRLAVPVDLYSDLWLSWPAKKGERLRDLVVPEGNGEVEPHMMAMAVVDYEERVVEWRVNGLVVFVDMA